MKQFPMPFDVMSESVQGIQTSWAARAQNQVQPIAVSIPPEFDGPGAGFSPEDLYALALQNCFIATFKVFAEKSRLNFSDINIQSRLEIDRNESGQPWMARISFRVKLSGVEQKEVALRLLDRTSKGCMILNSVNTHKEFYFDVQ